MTMSSDQLQSCVNAFNQCQEKAFISPPLPHSITVPVPSHTPPAVPNTFGVMGSEMRGERESTQMGFGIVGHEKMRPWGFQPLMGREALQENGEDCNVPSGFERKELSLSNQGDQGNQQQVVGFQKNGQAKLCARGHWRPAEDAKLRELVAQFGPQNWNLIAEKLEGRSGKSCRLRWFNQLDPRINRRAFTEEEEERLLGAHRAYGNKWAMIARLFPGRTDNAVKNHWHVIMARKQREQSCIYRKRKPSVLHPTNYQNNNIIINNNNTTGSDLTISSTIIDESASTCTDLYLSISSTKHWAPGALHPPQQHQYSALPKGSLIEGIVMGVEQSGHSDTNSEASVADNRGNGNGKLNLPFFDFLGVGAS
ncbi:hypothetical protein Ancab_033205 [Ancistrocladus abbreviatus]